MLQSLLISHEVTRYESFDGMLETGTLKTAQIQDLETLTFGVEITVNDIYDSAGNLVSENETGNMPTSTPSFMKQSSALYMDYDQNSNHKTDRRSSALYGGSEFKMEAMAEKLKSLQEQQDAIISELQNMKAFLGDEYKGTDLEKTTVDEDMQKVREWLETQCKMGQYLSAFRVNGIDNLKICRLLTMDNLETMGIKKLGHRVQILHEIAKLKEKEEALEAEKDDSADYF